MRSKKTEYTFAATNAIGYAENATGASWTLTATTAADGCAHPVTIHNDSASDHSGKSIELAGTDAEGRAITEHLHLPNTHGGGSDTVTSVLYYKTVTSPIVPSATIGTDTMDIGYTAVAVTPTYPISRSTEALMSCVVGGTINYTPQKTNDAIYTDTTPDWQTLTAAGTASTMTAVPLGVTGLRVLVNSHTSGTLNVTYSQVMTGA
jgi:hypothetical protein